MTADDALAIYAALENAGVPVWIVGGWGVDALAGRETREHHDLDILVSHDHSEAFWHFVERRGYRLKLLWPKESTFHDGRPTAFVVTDDGGREVDVHLFRSDPSGNVPLWITDRAFTPDALTGQGRIGTTSVRCITVEMQLRAHTGYDLPDEHRKDLALLRRLHTDDHPRH